MYKYLLLIILGFLSACNLNRNTDNNRSERNDKKFADAPGEYLLTDDAKEVEIPLEMHAGNKPMIIGRVNGKKVKFLIDNGKLFDEVWFYNGEVDSIALFFKSQNADSLIGIGENSASLIFEGTQINVDFAQIQFKNQPTLISPSDAGYADFFPGINGQVSSMLFKHFIVKFDFENNMLKLTEPEMFKKSRHQNAIKMHKRENSSYCLPFELYMKTGSVHKVLLDIDIGTVFPLFLISNNSNNIPIPSNQDRIFLGVGASGNLYGYNDTLKELRFGDYVVKNYPTMIVKAETNADTSIVESGTFGIELMKQFNVTFDYFNEVLYFEPNKKDEKNKVKH